MNKQELHAKFGPKLVGPVPGPKAKAAVEADGRLISPSYTRSYPLVAKRGRGCRVEDVDGNEFLDFAAGIAVTSTGHCHPEVVAAIQKQAAELIHISGTDFYNEPLTELAEKLSAVAPMRGPHRVFYGNSGAEAIECAIKLARYHTGTAAHHCVPRSISRAHDGRAFADRVEAAAEAAIRATDAGRDARALSVCVSRMHGRSAGRRSIRLGCARYIEEKLFKTILPPEEVAAIFVEPIQGEGGYVVAPDNFLRELRGICDRHGILLVADEVQSGAGRTGKWWAIEHSGVEPDIVCMAKGIASGMPLGVCMSKAEIMDWVPGSHASTFGGNPVSIAAALATIDILQREAIENAAKVGAKMLERLHGWKKTHPLVGDVRGRGLMIGIELVKDKETREPATELRNRVETLAFENGLMILGCGETSIRLCPPLIVSEEEATVGLDILEDVLTQVETERTSRRRRIGEIACLASAWGTRSHRRLAWYGAAHDPC